MIIVLMGVAGAGKSTIDKLLATELDWPFYDGDDFHPLSNREKIKQGRPLTDEDRAAWLQGALGIHRRHGGTFPVLRYRVLGAEAGVSESAGGEGAGSPVYIFKGGA